MRKHSKTLPNQARIDDRLTPVIERHIKNANPRGTKLPTYEDVIGEEEFGLRDKIVNFWENGLNDSRRPTKVDIARELLCSEWLVKHTLMEYDKEHGLKRSWKER